MGSAYEPFAPKSDAANMHFDSLRMAERLPIFLHHSVADFGILAERKPDPRSQMTRPLLPSRLRSVLRHLDEKNRTSSSYVTTRSRLCAE